MAELVRSFKIFSPEIDPLTKENVLLFDLNDKNTFGSYPTEVGSSMVFDVISDAAFSYISLTSYQASDLTFTTWFGHIDGEPYKAFYEFASKLKFKTYILEYFCPGFDAPWRRDVVLTSISKQEIDKDAGILPVDISFRPTSLWYRWVPINEFVPVASDSTTKIYNTAETSIAGNMYPQPYIYLAGASDLGTTFSIQNNSVYSGVSKFSGLKVELFPNTTQGPILNPGWEIYDTKGTLVGKDQFNISINPGTSFEFSSDPTDSHVYLWNTDIFNEEPLDIVNTLDISVSTFSLIPLGLFTFNGLGSDWFWDATIAKITYKEERIAV